MFRFVQLRRTSVPVRLGLTIFGIKVYEDHDSVGDTPTYKRTVEQISAMAENETGWDRLKILFEKDEFGGYSPELESAISAGVIGLLVGGTWGGLGAARRSYEDFIEKNKASQFKSHFDAKYQLQNSVTKAMGIGAWRFGWRLGLFMGSFVFFTTAVSTYRNKTTVFEFAAGGLLGGATYKIPMGVKGMVSGGLAGCVLGTIAGCISVPLMILTGTTTEELRYWRRGWKEASAREFTSVKNPKRLDTLGELGLSHELELMERLKKETEKENNGDSAQKEPPKDVSKKTEQETK